MDPDRLIGAILAPLPGPLGRWYETAEGRKKLRYALVSVVAVPTGTVFIAVGNTLLGLTAGWANAFGNSVGAIPSYLLSRYWVWGKSGKNHLITEILPFWAVSITGILFSLEVGHLAGQLTRRHDIGGLPRLVILLGANIGAFGILWVAKYILFNKVLFVVRADDGVAVAPTGGGDTPD